MKNMKKIICALLACTMIILTAAGCDTSKNGDKGDALSSQADLISPHKFGRTDAKLANGVAIGMTVSQVKEIMGEPDTELTTTEGEFIYGARTTLKYNELILTFYDVSGGDDFTLGVIYSSSESDIFAQGLHVNSTEDEVLQAFTQDEQRSPLYFDNSGTAYGDYVYGDINENMFLDKKPQGELYFAYENKYSMIEGHDNEYMIEYYYWEPIAWSEDGEGYTGTYYSMVFYMDGETNLVTSIMLTYDYRG